MARGGRDADAMSTRVATAVAPATANQENVAPVTKQIKTDPPAQDAAKKKRCARASASAPLGPLVRLAVAGFLLGAARTSRVPHPPSPSPDQRPPQGG